MELKGNYYNSYLEKINKKLNKPWSIHGAHHRNLNQFVLRESMKLPFGSIVIDAGCGLSTWLTQSVEKNITYVGLDCQEESIAFGIKHFPNRDYRLGDIYNLPYNNKSIDAVVMKEVIEHIKVPEIAIKEVVRVLKPTGIFILTTPNYGNPFLYLIEHTYNRFLGGTCKPYLPDVHPSKFRKKTLFNILKDNFKSVEINTISLKITLTAVASKPI